jgi:hypothetical protein
VAFGVARTQALIGVRALKSAFALILIPSQPYVSSSVDVHYNVEKGISGLVIQGKGFI